MYDPELLVSAGFTRSEAKAYLGLVELGASKTGKLCEKVGIPSSHIYRILGSLIQKGVITYKLMNNEKVYEPNPPESLKVLYLTKEEALAREKREIEKVIATLQKLPKQKEAISDYKYFEGIGGIKAMWLEINKLLVPNTQVEICISTIESWERLNVFYLEHHKARAAKHIKERMILPLDAKKFAKQREKIGFITTRFMDLRNQAEFGVYQDMAMIQYTGATNPRGFLIKDRVFAQTFKNIFDVLWGQAKP